MTTKQLHPGKVHNMINGPELFNIFRFLSALAIVGYSIGCGGKCKLERSDDCRLRETFVATTKDSFNDGSLCCTLSVEGSKHFAPNGPDMIRVELKNTGSEDCSFVEYDDFPEVLSLRAPDGSSARLTKFGKQRGEPRSYFSVSAIAISSGLSRVWKFDLCRIFDLHLPGKYLLVVSRPVKFAVGAEDKIFNVTETVELVIDKELK